MRGLEAIPTLLRSHGITTVFAMLAETNGPWLGYGVEHGLLRLVRVRHEETAVMAAVGFARSTGQVGVASVTRGPGFANSINALAAAADTNMPLLLLTGDSPRAGAQTQQLPQREIANALGVGYHRVLSVAELPFAIQQAVESARWHGRPQVVAIAEDVLGAEAEFDRPPVTERPAIVPNATAIDALAGMLAGADRPLIIAGHGAFDAEPTLRKLGERVGAGLGTTLLAIRMFQGHPNNVGLVGGWAPSAARNYFQSVDLVVAFGASLNRFTLDRGRLFSEAAIAQVVLDPAAASTVQHPDVLVLGDAGLAARALQDAVDRIGMSPKPYAGVDFSTIQTSLVGVENGRAREGLLDVIAVATALDARLPADRIIVTDSGRAVIPLPDLLAARDARSWLHGRGYGSIGQGLGLALGAAVAHADRTTVLFVGDGAFLAACHDLDAIRLASVRNLIIVVLNDERYGMETRVMNQHGLLLDVINQTTPDLVALARVYGGDGVCIADVSDLAEFDVPVGQGLFLIDARIDPESDPARAVGDGLETK